jgi:hypothetical protein
MLVNRCFLNPVVVVAYRRRAAQDYSRKVVSATVILATIIGFRISGPERFHQYSSESS